MAQHGTAYGASHTRHRTAQGASKGTVRRTNAQRLLRCNLGTLYGTCQIVCTVGYVCTVPPTRKYLGLGLCVLFCIKKYIRIERKRTTNTTPKINVGVGLCIRNLRCVRFGQLAWGM